MTAPANPSLLRDWTLLQERVVPPLLDCQAHRRPAAWTIGSAKDAIAVAVAYEHASHDHRLQVFLSGCSWDERAVKFGPTDLRGLPEASRSSSFRHCDRRWIPERRIVERVILGQPDDSVDVVTVRGLQGLEVSTSPPDRSPLTQLRAGGHLMFIDDAPERFDRHPDFCPVDGSGRVFRKLSPATATPASDDVADRQTLAERQALTSLVESHLGLARSLARRFVHHGESVDDLEQVAFLALVRASKRFDPDRGYPFAAFAAASILGELKRHFRDKTWMLRVPRSLQETYLLIKDAREEVGHKLGCSPTVQQIAEHLGISEEAVLDGMEAGDSYWPASLDTPRNEDEPVTEVPVVDPGFERSLDRRQLRESLPRLTEREQLIVKRLYFDGWTQRRVAEEIGVSQMQVSRLMLRTLTKLRSWLEE